MRPSILPPVSAMAARALENLRDTLRIVRGRFARRPVVYPRLPWALWGVAILALAAACAIFLDGPAARQVGRWPAVFQDYAGVFTVLGLGQWYLVPAAIWLLVANQIDWRSLSLHRVLAAYERTCVALFVLAAVGVPGIAANIVKIFVGRARPTLFDELGAFSFHPLKVAYRYASFPSGHATTMGSVAAVLMLLFPRARYPLLLVCIWIASTRVFVGAHYPSDTVMGFGLGFGLAVLTAQVFARLGFLFRPMPAGLPVLRSSFRRTGKDANPIQAQSDMAES